MNWIFEYLLHEPDLEILKEIMPQRQQNKILHNDNMECLKISAKRHVSSVWCGSRGQLSYLAYGMM